MLELVVVADAPDHRRRTCLDDDVAMSAGFLLQILVAGLAAGAVYGLVGIGYSLIYRMSGVLNFAHGDLVSVAIFAFLLVVGGGAEVAASNAGGVLLWFACAVALVGTVAVAIGLERFAVAPFLARGSALGWIAATAAAGLLVRSLIAFKFPAEGYTVPEIIPVKGLGRGGVLDLPGGGVLQLRDLAVLAVAVLLAVTFDQWLALGRTGQAMRAAADSPDAARLMGISPQRMMLLAFTFAGALAAVSGLLLAPERPVSLQLGVIIGLKGVAAAVLGGLGSARGALVAGLAIGLGESLLSSGSTPGLSLGPIQVPQIGPLGGLHDVAALALLVLVLALIPGRLGAADEAVD
jgi:branched-chain amino acid transport system permease protein